MSTHFPLCNLETGQSATIAALDAHSELFHRLTAMGFRVGKRVKLLRAASFSGPLHVRIGTTDVMMRRREGERVRVVHAEQPAMG